MNSTMNIIYGDPQERYRAVLKTDIVYAHREKADLQLQLMGPDVRLTKKIYPCVIFVNAGGWGRPDSFAELPQMMEFAHHGYMVASIEHRGIDREDRNGRMNVQDSAKFPDAIADLKEAIRFLRANSEELGIDAGRIAVMGSATGAHTALMAAVTSDDDLEYTGENREYPATVQAVIDLYGQADLTHMVEDRLAMPEHKDFDILPGNYPIELLRLFGSDQKKYEEQMAAASPVTYITREKEIPPMLIIHDEGNHVVPIEQSVRLINKLRECGKRGEMYKVVGAKWLSGIWTADLVEIMVKFLDAVM